MHHHNPASLSGLDDMRGVKDGLYPAPPYAEVADVWPTSVEAGHIIFEGAPSARFYNPMGTVHGGRIASAEGKLFDARGRLIAQGTETCAIMDMGPAR